MNKATRSSMGLFSCRGTASQVLEYLEALQTVFAYEAVHKMPVQLTARTLVLMPYSKVLERARIISRKWNSN